MCDQVGYVLGSKWDISCGIVWDCGIYSYIPCVIKWDISWGASGISLVGLCGIVGYIVISLVRSSGM